MIQIFISLSIHRKVLLISLDHGLHVRPQGLGVLQFPQGGACQIAGRIEHRAHVSSPSFEGQRAIACDLFTRRS